jgi:hypothetical protein
MHIFRHIFLSSYWWQESDIWSQASYIYICHIVGSVFGPVRFLLPISWETFFDPSDSYFLFAEERGYHRWALAHSSSCLICFEMLTIIGDGNILLINEFNAYIFFQWKLCIFSPKSISNGSIWFRILLQCQLPVYCLLYLFSVDRLERSLETDHWSLFLTYIMHLFI